MWSCVAAATPGDSHNVVDKYERDRENSMAYREGKVFMVSRQNDDPGPSGQNTAELSKSSTSSKNNSRSPPTSQAQIEDGIEICNDGPTEEPGARGGWLGRNVSRLSRAIRYRISGETRAMPPDWFLNKFSSQAFTDPQEPLYVAAKSKILCGLKLFFDPTLPGHYNGSVVSKEHLKFRHVCLPVTEVNYPTLFKENLIEDVIVIRYAKSFVIDRKLNLIAVEFQIDFGPKWLGLVSLAILYNLIFIIARAVFWELNNVSHDWIWYVLDYLCDAIYLIDTIINMHEGYLEQGLIVKDVKMLRKHYFKSAAWPYDFISLLPTDLAYFWWAPESCGSDRLPCPVIVRLNRLARLPRMWEWFELTETATSYPNAFRIWKVVMGILVLIHWNACFYFSISYGVGFGTDNWVYNITGDRNRTLTHQYIYSFYWSTLTLTTIGETPQPEIDVEYLFVVTDFLAGVLIFATIVGSIGSMISNMNVARVEFQNKMDGVKQYMAFRKVSGELEERVIRWFAYTWAQSGALDEENVLSSLPDKLKAEIAIRVHLDTLRQVRIFQDCEPGLLEALVLKLRLQVFSPGDYICRKGDVGKEMYIVKRGRLQVVADDGKTVLAVLTAGSVFGEVSVLDIAGNRTGNRRTANVRALGYSDLFCLAKRDLWEALADYPDARATLTERGCQLLRKDGLLDEAIFEKAQTSQLSVVETVSKLESTIEVLNNRLEGLMSDIGEEQAKIKKKLTKMEMRVILSDGDFTESEDRTSSDETEIKSEVASESFDYSELGMSESQGTSTGFLGKPMLGRERGHSLTVERTPSLSVLVQPRSKSLRVKKTLTAFSN